MRLDQERWQRLAPPGAFSPDQVIRDLGDGLVLRRAGEADATALERFTGAVQADPPRYEYDAHAALWARDLAAGTHPRARVGDFTIVEDTQRHRIASSLCLIPHRFRYGDIELAGGQPELVGTHPDYRRRGLVAAQFDVIHDWAAERGQLLQIIDGIPWFYRQFGYEMALENASMRIAYPWNLKDVQVPEGLAVRDAEARDAEFLAYCHARGAERDLISCVRDADFCRYELSGRSPMAMRSRVYRVVESGSVPVAAFNYWPLLLDGRLLMGFFEVAEGVAWQQVAPALLADLCRAGQTFAQRDGGELASVLFRLGSAHPLYDVASDRLPHAETQHAWYVRVPDLVGFLRQVAPTLEARLAESTLAGHSGRIDVSLYWGGVRLLLERGRIAEVESWLPSTDEAGDVAFPDLVFLQLVFGFRSLSELQRSFPDCVVRNAAQAAVVQALFPRQASNLVPTD